MSTLTVLVHMKQNLRTVRGDDLLLDDGDDISILRVRVVVIVPMYVPDTVRKEKGKYNNCRTKEKMAMASHFFF